MTTKIERSFISGAELRAAAGSDFALVGMAASYNMPSKPIPGSPNGGSFIEYVAPTAFKRALREKQDVKCLFNHSANYVLGRTKNGTLTLTDTSAGLAFRCALNPKMSSHQDLYSSVKRGDISE